MEGGTRVFTLLCVLVAFRAGNAQRFFNGGIPGASRVIPGGAVPVNSGASRSFSAGASRIASAGASRTVPVVQIPQEESSVRSEVSGLSLDHIDAAIDSALGSLQGGRVEPSEQDVSTVRGSARGAPSRGRLQAFSRARIQSAVRDTQTNQDEPIQQATESRPPLRRIEVRRPSQQQESRSPPQQQESRSPSQQQESRSPSQQTESRSSVQQSRSRPSFQRGRTQDSQLSGQNSRRQESIDVPQPREQSFVPRRGSEQVFDPSRNPLGDSKRPRVQHLDGARQDEGALQPLSNDFLPSCPDATFSYIIPSPTQCDLYYVCEYGTPSRKVCEDGLVFSIEQVKCVPAEIEDCKDRPLLQTPKGTGPCTRRHGIFYTNDTCTDFVTCRDNVASFERCAEGLVFDPQQKICAWADEALRTGCMPEDLLGFRCPNPKLTQEEALLSRVHLKFGDHDRHADPTDCRYFFMCLVTGQPRRAGCGRGKVFDRATGICRLAKDVPECSNYYGGSQGTTGQPGVGQPTDARILRIQEDIRRQFASTGETRGVSQLLRSKRDLMEEAEPEGY